MAVFHKRLFLPLTTATIITSFLTRLCTYKFLWHFKKELVRNKHAVEELPSQNQLVAIWVRWYQEC